MVRVIGYAVARRAPEDPDEPRDWAPAIEAFLRGLVARFTSRPVLVPRR